MSQSVVSPTLWWNYFQACRGYTLSNKWTCQCRTWIVIRLALFYCSFDTLAVNGWAFSAVRKAWAGTRSPLRPLLAVPNITAHPLAATVPITVLLTHVTQGYDWCGDAGDEENCVRCSHHGDRRLVVVFYHAVYFHRHLLPLPVRNVITATGGHIANINAHYRYATPFTVGYYTSSKFGFESEAQPCRYCFYSVVQK